MSNSSDVPAEQVSDADPTRAARLLRRHHTGVLLFGERRRDVRFLIEPDKGELVLPIESVALSEDHWVVVSPDESDRRMEILLEPHEIERPEAEACVDRWRAYHGEAPKGRWARCTILGMRGWVGTRGSDQEPEVFEASTLSVESTLKACEGRLLKLLNAKRERLGEMCRRAAKTEVAEPLCVGVDQFGLDVRARFGIVRVEFPGEATSEEQATKEIEGMLSAKRET